MEIRKEFKLTIISDDYDYIVDFGYLRKRVIEMVNEHSTIYDPVQKRYALLRIEIDEMPKM